MTGAEEKPNVDRALSDRELIEASPFLDYLVGDGSWREAQSNGLKPDDFAEAGGLPSIRDFRRDFRKTLDDTEAALISLRRLRIRTILGLARADLGNQVKPHQIRARLRALSEALVQGAWWAAEASLREKYVHPIILERRNINPPMAVFSLSRLGAGEPWYTTGPAPIFVHSRAAEFAPALTEKDFEAARRAGKEWLPARDYFHRLARRTMSYLSVPDPAGKGFGHMAEDVSEDQPGLLPGALVILYSAFEEHFLGRRPLRERLSLMRLRFLVGQEKLGRAVEKAAREALLKTAAELGSRLKPGVNAWYRERAQAEGFPLARGGLLDIERRLRLLQFAWANDDLSLLDPSPLKALDYLAEKGIISGDARLVLNRSYSFQWFLANRLSLLGRRTSDEWEDLKAGKLDERLRLPGAGADLVRHMKASQAVLTSL